MFNSGGMGARPGLDGLSATAFPSGVMTMPIEATEQTGPVVVWRKELRPDSGGDGQYRGGLGQVIEIEALPGHEFDFSAMFDRMNHRRQGPRRRQGRGRWQGGAGRWHGAEAEGLAACARRAAAGAAPAGRAAGSAIRAGAIRQTRRNDLAKGYVTETAR